MNTKNANNDDWLHPETPYSIAHRGASDYEFANSVNSFVLAQKLGADFWEIDLQFTFDKQVIAYHDEHLGDGELIRDLKYDEIKKKYCSNRVPLFSEIVKIAKKENIGIYADIKSEAAVDQIIFLLKKHKIKRSILSSFNRDLIKRINTIEHSYPTAILVPVNTDPFSYSQDAEIIHLCWEKLESPEKFLDKKFFDRCEKENKKVVLWHEENPARMSFLREKPVFGICSNKPELVKPFFKTDDEWPVKVVCHRGVNNIAPENTIPSTHLTFAAGFSHVEVDVRETKDEKLVIIHDSTLDRTTNKLGKVSDICSSELKEIDAGSWFSDFFTGLQIPKLDDILEIVNFYNGKIYIEIKNADPERVWNKVCEYSLQKKCFFWSGDKKITERLATRFPEAKIMLRRKDFKTLEDILDNFSPSIIEYTMEDDLTEFDTLNKHNIETMIAFMGNDKNAFLRLIEKRPNYVNLDAPLIFKSLYEGRFQ